MRNLIGQFGRYRELVPSKMDSTVEHVPQALTLSDTVSRSTSEYVRAIADNVGITDEQSEEHIVP